MQLVVHTGGHPLRSGCAGVALIRHTSTGRLDFSCGLGCRVLSACGPQLLTPTGAHEARFVPVQIPKNCGILDFQCNIFLRALLCGSNPCKSCSQAV